MKMIICALAMLLITLVTDSIAAPPNAAEQEAVVERKELRRELLERVEKDQQARMALLAWMREQGSKDPDVLKASDDPRIVALRKIDQENATRLKQVVAESGWPVASQVGSDGAHAAWLLLQHADHDPTFQLRCLELMKQAAKGEVSGTDTAYLSDRVSMKQIGKQLYGTQLRQVEGKWVPQPLIDPAHVDELRAQAGLQPLADYIRFASKMMAGTATSPRTPKQIQPLVRTVDLNLGEETEVILANGETVQVKLLSVNEERDSIRAAVRRAKVTVEIDGRKATIHSATYHLPITLGPIAAGRVQIDCPITKGHVQPNSNPWSLDKDARLRLWPADSPWIQPGTFVYPVNQRWFASHTLMANEIGDDERPDDTSIYYHWGLDLGGAEKLVDVLAATDGIVVSAGDTTISSEEIPSIVHPRYDVIYVRDGRGWYYRYSHLDSIEAEIKPGTIVRMGQKIGVLGKRGASGGWSHLHFDIGVMQPSGRYGITDGYAFLWEAYRQQHDWKIQAVTRPHQLVWTNEVVTLDGSRSVSLNDAKSIQFKWILSDGTTAQGPMVNHKFADSGTYSEILQVSDEDGNVDYDFAVVQVLDRNKPSDQPPTVHAAYWPTFGIKAGDEVTFKVRSFRIRSDDGDEVWDFGDGTPPVIVHSDGNATALAPDGYAVTTHRFANPGHYVVAVRRTNHRGQTGTARLQVRVN